MKTKMILLTIGLVMGLTAYSQEKQKASIAVALPHLENFNVSREIVAKLIQIELIKLDEYRVYDEFDMKEVTDLEERFLKDCYGKNCLIDLGNKLGADYIVSSSILVFGGKSVITIKFIDVKTGDIFKSDVREFIDNNKEVQRMMQLMIRQMHGIQVHSEDIARITFDNQPVIKNNVGTVNNSGPRIGYSFFTGDLGEFARRPEAQGGLDIFPSATLIGYQLEKQYIGTENFSALGEVLFMVSGLEKGYALPSITFMNGFRFGKAGWEIAFGPGFGIKRTSEGFFDVDGLYGEAGQYWRESDFRNSNHYDVELNPEPAYGIRDILDNRGSRVSLNTRWVMAFGRTFRAGGLNIPVNVFYSSMKNASMVGLSVGFNVVKN
jgi:hypothetical protein